MSWNKMCRALNCCKRPVKPITEDLYRVEVSIAQVKPLGQSYTDTLDNIPDTLADAPPAATM